MRRGLDCQLDLLGLSTITVTVYHSAHTLQHYSRPQHKAGNGSSASVPMQPLCWVSCQHYLITLRLNWNEWINYYLRSVWQIIHLDIKPGNWPRRKHCLNIVEWPSRYQVTPSSSVACLRRTLHNMFVTSAVLSRCEGKVIPIYF
jgi:hypothetical protein